jgi:hypothetical protein
MEEQSARLIAIASKTTVRDLSTNVHFFELALDLELESCMSSPGAYPVQMG